MCLTYFRSIHSKLPGAVLMYACGHDTVINGASFHSQKCPGLNDNLSYSSLTWTKLKAPGSVTVLARKGTLYWDFEEILMKGLFTKVQEGQRESTKHVEAPGMKRQGRKWFYGSLVESQSLRTRAPLERPWSWKNSNTRTGQPKEASFYHSVLPLSFSCLCLILAESKWKPEGKEPRWESWKVLASLGEKAE